MGQALLSWASFANQGESFDKAEFQMIFISIFEGSPQDFLSLRISDTMKSSRSVRPYRE
jgi:hypothetical protein